MKEGSEEESTLVSDMGHRGVSLSGGIQKASPPPTLLVASAVSSIVVDLLIRRFIFLVTSIMRSESRKQSFLSLAIPNSLIIERLRVAIKSYPRESIVLQRDHFHRNPADYYRALYRRRDKTISKEDDFFG